MPRSISRVAFTAASFISLAVCLATLGLWLHSTQRLDRLRSGTPTRRISLHSKDGELYIDLARASSPIFSPGYQHIHALPTQYCPPTARWKFAGLGAGSKSEKTYQGMIEERFVEIPLWLVVVLSSVLPVLWFDVRDGQKDVTQMASSTGADTRADIRLCSLHNA